MGEIKFVHISELDDIIANTNKPEAALESWDVIEYEDGERTLYHKRNEYEIEEDRLFNETDWLQHLKAKTWFDEKEELSFLRGCYYLSLKRNLGK